MLLVLSAFTIFAPRVKGTDTWYENIFSDITGHNQYTGVAGTGLLNEYFSFGLYWTALAIMGSDGSNFIEAGLINDHGHCIAYVSYRENDNMYSRVANTEKEFNTSCYFQIARADSYDWNVYLDGDLFWSHTFGSIWHGHPMSTMEGYNYLLDDCNKIVNDWFGLYKFDHDILNWVQWVNSTVTNDYAPEPTIAWNVWGQKISDTEWNNHMKLPRYGLKTKEDGYFYIPNRTDLAPILKINDYWSGSPDLTGDQKGAGYLGTVVNPDGVVNILDSIFIGNHMNTHEGDANWEYMCDIKPDKVINILDAEQIGLHYGNNGTYTHVDTQTIFIHFIGNGQDTWTTCWHSGWKDIPSWATEFYLYDSSLESIGARILFFTTSYG